VNKVGSCLHTERRISVHVTELDQSSKIGIAFVEKSHFVGKLE
jgi:hypothetical protein